MRPASPVVFLVVGAVLLAAGWIVRYGESYERLVANTEVVADPEKFTDFVGRWTIASGALVAALGVAPDILWTEAFLVGAIVVLTAVSLYILVGAWRIAGAPAE